MIDGLVNKHRDPVILAGDLNCHVGKDGGPRANVMSAVSDTPRLLYLSKINCDNVSYQFTVVEIELAVRK